MVALKGVFVVGTYVVAGVSQVGDLHPDVAVVDERLYRIGVSLATLTLVLRRNGIGMDI